MINPGYNDRMKVVLEFDLPEQKESYDRAFHGGKAIDCIKEIHKHLKTYSDGETIDAELLKERIQGIIKDFEIRV